MRIAILAAFPFPYPQGSQVYVTGQAQALARAGDDVTLFVYGCGEGEVPVDLTIERVAAALSPGVFRSGPQWRKPLADAGLLARLLSSHRRSPFDIALAHNAEAAVVGIAARSITRTPVVYCAHTLMGEELSAYASPQLCGLLDPVGAGIDRWVAAHADALIALSADGMRALERSTSASVQLIPPGLRVTDPPSREQQRATCERYDLRHREFALYSGNLDAYQDLELLAAAARIPPRLRHPVVIATHDASHPPVWSAAEDSPIRCLEVRSFDEMRALCHAASTLVLTRRRRGGFPIKLLNYMEAARPIVAFEDIAAGLTHDENAWLLPPDAGASEFVEALRALEVDPQAGERLGTAARRHLERHHDWDALAAETRLLCKRTTRA